MARKYSSKKKAATTSSSSKLKFSYCDQPEPVRRVFNDGVSGNRQGAIINHEKKWVNGTKLHYYFFTNGPWRGATAERDVVREAFNIWKKVGVGLEFVEVTDIDEAEVRIGFKRGDGSWSYLGRDILLQGQSDRTMNFGWDIKNDIDTAIHEIGHTLAMPHEHQNPNAGIIWNEEAVYESLAQPPNSWSRDQTFWNIIRKLPIEEVEGTDWDPDSIMHYPFEPGMILQPSKFQTQPLLPKAGLSNPDKAWIKTTYPSIGNGDHLKLAPFESISMELEAGEQADFMVRPAANRSYDFSTFGDSDTVMVLFEDVEGDLRYITADDDSGEDFNAGIAAKLFSDRKYVLRVRLYWQHRKGDFAVMMW